MTTTILVIDDCEDDQLLYQRACKDLAYPVKLVSTLTAADGFAYISNPDSKCPGSKRPDLILLDYNLPDMDGLSFMKRLSTCLDTPIPIVMLTGEGNAEIAVEVMKHGADDYLVKDTAGRYLKLLPGVIGRVMTAQVQREQIKRLQEERNSSAQMLHENESRLKDLFENLSSGVAVYRASSDGKDFFFSAFNRAAERIESVCREDLIGKNVAEVFPGIIEFGLLDVFRHVWQSGVEQHFPIAFYKDGRIAGWRENYVYKLPNGEIVAIYDDVTRQKQAEEEILLENQAERKRAQVLAQQFGHLLQGSFNEIYLFDANSLRFVQASEGAKKNLGYSASELELLTPLDLIISFTPQSFASLLAPLLSGEKQTLLFEAVQRRKDGTTYPAEVRLQLMEADTPLFLTIIQDITERKQAEQKLQRLNRALRLLSLCNAALVHAEEEPLLLVEICRIIVEAGGYRMAWVGFAEHDAEKTVRPVAHYGSDDHYLDNANISWADTERGRGPTGAAIRTCISQINQNFLTNPLATPWQVAALACGYQSSVSLYLGNREKTFGALTLYSAEPYAFGAPEVLLLEELAGDLAFGIAALRARAEQKQAKNELSRQKQFIWQVMNTDPNLIYVKDKDGKFLMANLALANLYGITMLDMIGKTDQEINSGRKWIPAYLALDTEVFKDEQEVMLTESSMMPDGQQHWYLAIKKPLPQADGSVNVLGIAVNITGQKRSEIKLDESYKELQRLTGHLENVKEEERTRIARELHDEMGATLAALKMRIAWLASRLPAELTQLSEEAGHISNLVSDGIHTIRLIVSQLRPILLEDAGLDAAIENCVNQFRRNTNIECMLSLPGKELALGAEQSAAIFRILQESLNNIAKHAQASKVEVLLVRRGNALLMVVEDNGTGFVQTHKEKSFGLLGIKERALIAGGKADISSIRGKGTRVSVTVPALKPGKGSCPQIK